MMECYVSSVGDYINQISIIYKKWRLFHAAFLRGQNNSNYSLIPGIFRNDYPESDFCHEFRGRSSAIPGTPEHDSLDKWLFLMQHHGVPTRLLDWTESPLVALYFALYKIEEGNDAAVYVLNPTALNKMICGLRMFPERNDPSYKYRFISCFYKNFQQIPWDYGLDKEKLTDSPLPMAIKPILIHERMIAQKSCFTIHGSDRRSIEEILAGPKMKNILQKIIIKSEYVKNISRELRISGVTHSNIFPDMDGIAIDVVERTKANSMYFKV